MNHLSGCSQVYLSKKGHDELFEDLNAQIYQKKKKKLVSNFVCPNCGCSSCFLFMAVHLA